MHGSMQYNAVFISFIFSDASHRLYKCAFALLFYKKRQPKTISLWLVF